MANLSDLFPAPTSTFSYSPAAMFYSSNSYFSRTSIATSGNKFTIIFRFLCDSFTGNTYGYPVIFEVSSATRVFNALVYSSDYSDTELQGKLQVHTENSSGDRVCGMLSSSVLCDGEFHTVFFSFDGDAGTAEFIVDGVDADDTGYTGRMAPTTGSLSNSSIYLNVGSRLGGLGITGAIGFFGMDDSGGLSWSDFMDSNGNPIKQDELTWSNSGFGSQPIFWNEHGEMSNNQGSAGNMTKNGTIVIAPAIDPA